MSPFRRYPERILRAKTACLACFALVAIVEPAVGMAAAAATLHVVSAAVPQGRQSQPARQLFEVRVPTGPPYGASSTGGDTTSFSLPVFERLRQDRRAFADVMAYAPLGTETIAVHAGDITEMARGAMVSGNFLSGLGVKMELGDGFKMEDERRHAPFIVLSLDYWTHLYSRNPGVLGETIYVNDVPFAILGVTAQGFSGVVPGKPTDFWIPLQDRPELTPWGIAAKEQTVYGSPKWWCLGLIARLTPGMDAQRAAAEATPGFRAAVYASLGAPRPDDPAPALSLVPAPEIGGLKEDSGKRMPVLKALAALLLLMACGYAMIRITMRIRMRQAKRRQAQSTSGERAS